MIVERHIDIGRPPAQVFEFLTDASAFGQVDPALVHVSPSGPLTAGSTGTFTHRRAGGLTVTTAWEVTELRSPDRVVVDIVGRGYQLRESVDLQATPSGTRMTVIDALAPTSLVGRAFVALSGPSIRRDLEARSVRLKSILEGQAVGG